MFLKYKVYQYNQVHSERCNRNKIDFSITYTSKPITREVTYKHFPSAFIRNTCFVICLIKNLKYVLKLVPRQITGSGIRIFFVCLSFQAHQ